MSLPNPGMNFTPFDQLPAADLDDLVENIEALAAGTGFNSGVLGSILASLVDGVAVQAISSASGAVATGTTVLPYDDTVPQITEGIEFLTATITPRSATNKLVIEVTLNLSHSAAVNMGIALFQNATASALAANRDPRVDAGGVGGVATLRYAMVAGTTSPITFRARAGGGSAGTTTFNGELGARKYGGVMSSSMTIREYKYS